MSIQPRTFGEAVFLAAMVLIGIALWYAAEWAGPYLGQEITTGLGALIGLFAVVGALKLGEEARWWLESRQQRSTSAR